VGIIDTLFSGRSFFIRNEDTGQELQGQFPAQEVKKEVASKYSSTAALNMETPVRQYISGETDTITFVAVFFNDDDLLGKAEDDLKLIESWTKRDRDLKRPPICSFSIGDGFLSMGSCTIDKVSETFLQPTFLGKLHHVSCAITISRYEPYTLEGQEPGETRYHRAKEREYYELLTQQEYNSPELGDVIRQRHPSKPNLQVNDVVKLPSIEAIRTVRVKQTSQTFKTAYGKKDTPQRALRLYMFEKRNKTYIALI
jgi:hypothetical protein